VGIQATEQAVIQEVLDSLDVPVVPSGNEP